ASLRPSRAGSDFAIAPETDFAPTNVELGFRVSTVNRDGSAPLAVPAKICPANRDSVARVTAIRLMDYLLGTRATRWGARRPPEAPCGWGEARSVRPRGRRGQCRGCARSTSRCA